MEYVQAGGLEFVRIHNPPPDIDSIPDRLVVDVTKGVPENIMDGDVAMETVTRAPESITMATDLVATASGDALTNTGVANSNSGDVCHLVSEQQTSAPLLGATGGTIRITDLNDVTVKNDGSLQQKLPITGLARGIDISTGQIVSLVPLSADGSAMMSSGTLATSDSLATSGNLATTDPLATSGGLATTIGAGAPPPTAVAPGTLVGADGRIQLVPGDDGAKRPGGQKRGEEENETNHQQRQQQALSDHSYLQTGELGKVTTYQHSLMPTQVKLAGSSVWTPVNKVRIRGDEVK